MNQHRESSGGAGVAIAVALLLFVMVIGGVGLAAGFFLFSARSSPVMIAPPMKIKSATTVLTAIDEGPAVSTVLGTFPLTEFDIKETLESPALAVISNTNGAPPLTKVLLAYASQSGPEERTIHLATSINGGPFSAPTEFRKFKIFTAVSQSKSGKEVKRPIRALPQLAASNDKIFLGWIEPNAENTTVFYYVAESSDSGVTWSEPLRVHESDGARPNFISLAADEHGNVVASWLDQRAGIPQPFAAVKKADETKFQPESQVYSSDGDTGVCPCCPTAAAIGPDGTVYVAFRNQVDGYRDIYVASRKLDAGSEFGRAESVVKEPTWKFDGCPHDGPAIAVSGEAVAVAWMDAHSGQTRINWAAKRAPADGWIDLGFLEDPSNQSETQVKLSRFNKDHIFAVWANDVGALSETANTSDSGHAHGAAPGGIREIHFARGGLDKERVVVMAPSEALFSREASFQSRPVIVVPESDLPIIAFQELDEQGKRIVVVKVNE
jgi:hypothetical protein